MQLAIDNTLLRKQELCVSLRKKFTIKLAIDIQQHLVIEPIAPNKIGICFKNDFKLNQEQKNLLRESLRSVYGQNIAIVSLSKPQTIKNTAKTIKLTPQLPTTKVISSIPSMPQFSTQWQKVRKHLVSVYGEDLVKVSFEKLDISETQKKITFSGSDTFTEIVEGKFGANLNWLAKEYDLHFIFKGKSIAFAEPTISEIKK